MMDVTSSQFHCNTIDLETYHLCYKRWCIYCNSVTYCIFIIPDVCASVCVCVGVEGGGWWCGPQEVGATSVHYNALFI